MFPEDSKVSEFKRLTHEGEKKELCRGSDWDEASVNLRGGDTWLWSDAQHRVARQEEGQEVESGCEGAFWLDEENMLKWCIQAPRYWKAGRGLVPYYTTGYGGRCPKFLHLPN